MNDARRSNRRSRRRGSHTQTSAPVIEQKPFTQIKNPYQPVNLISEDQLESIHQGSLKVLAQTGIKVLHHGARKIMAEAGADVDDATQMVRFDPDLIAEYVAKAPREFTLHARNPEHSVVLGGDNLVFDMMASAPNCTDLDHGRRTGNHQDYQNFLRLSAPKCWELYRVSQLL